jgi:hypothetical protein
MSAGGVQRKERSLSSQTPLGMTVFLFGFGRGVKI